MKALVTGGGGFLGSCIVRRLLERGDDVRSLARGRYPSLREAGAETLRGDLRDAEQVAAACEGMDVVFHTAAKAGGWGDPALYEAINVQGTTHVIAGCRAAAVRALVYTSSPSVVSHPGDIEGADESLPYPDHYLAAYPRTKAEAERAALAADCEELRVVSLRPRWIWGPGDPHLLPRLLRRHDAGRLRRIGGRDPLIDSVFVENAAQAHLLAADKLLAGAAIGGRAYFISNGEPIGLWTLANRLMEAAGRPPIRRTVPVWVVKVAARLLEAIWTALGREEEPLMTRFGAQELSRASWYDISAARRDLGYEPTVSIDQGLARLKTWCEQGGLKALGLALSLTLTTLTISACGGGPLEPATGGCSEGGSICFGPDQIQYCVDRQWSEVEDCQPVIDGLVTLPTTCEAGNCRP